MLPIVCWAAKPTIAASTAVEARIPVARRFSSVNWLSASAATTRKMISSAKRRRNLKRVLVDRETCETAGDMEANLPATPAANMPVRRDHLPYSNWGPWAAIAGFLGAFVAQYMLAIPILIVDPSAASDDPSTAASILLQLITTATFLVVPLVIAASQGARGREAWRRLGLRGFDS